MKKLLLILCLLLTPLIAQAQEGPKEKEKKPKSEIATMIRDGLDLDEAVGEVRNWELKDLERYGILEALPDLLKSQKVLKRDRILLVELLQHIAFEVDGINQKSIADLILDLLKSNTSPTITKHLGETLFTLDNIDHTSTRKAISALMASVIDDATLDKKKQKYASLHSAAFSSISATRVEKSVAEKLTEMAKKLKKLDTTMQVAVMRAIGRLLITEEARSKFFKRKDLDNLTEYIVDALKDNPALVSQGLNVSVNEKERLVATLEPLFYLLPDPNNKTKEKSTGLKLMGDVLGHSDAEIVERAGRVLIEAKRLVTKSKLKVDVGELIHKQLKARQLNPDTLGHAGLLASYRLAIRLIGVLVTAEKRTDQADMAKLLGFLREQFFKNSDVTIKEIASDGFFMLEPAHFTENKLSKATKKEAAEFFKNCLEVFKIEQPENAVLNQLKEQCAAILFEMTGRDYNVDPELWQSWLKEEGRKFFN